MADSTPNRCPSAEGQSCKHGHVFTPGCLLPSERNVPSCCREDLVFDEKRQAVTIVRTDAAARFEKWKADVSGVAEAPAPKAPKCPRCHGERQIDQTGYGEYRPCPDCNPESPYYVAPAPGVGIPQPGQEKNHG